MIKRLRYAWLVFWHGEAWARAWITLENFERVHCNKCAEDIMTKEDEIYQRGFKDGFKDGLERGIYETETQEDV